MCVVCVIHFLGCTIGGTIMSTPLFFSDSGSDVVCVIHVFIGGTIMSTPLSFSDSGSDVVCVIHGMKCCVCCVCNSLSGH